MSHPFCATEQVCDHYPHGWGEWRGKSMYIRTIIDAGVVHRQACGEAIHRWNEAVGARFLLIPDRGVDTIMFMEASSKEWPFTDYPTAAGLAMPTSHQARIYIRSDQPGVSYREIVNFYAHEIGHAFSLADHPKDDINSVMSYQGNGRWLLGPSKEDRDSVAVIHGLDRLEVKPSDLEGIENITGFWHWDRYQGRDWRFWFPSLARGNTIDSLVPYETYRVRAKTSGILGYGRFGLAVEPGINRWAYL